MKDTVERARELFLGEEPGYGCAETTLVVLLEAFGRGAPIDPSPAFALNGGVAWQGSICGALTGAAIAAGMLAAPQMPYAEAKRAARERVERVIGEFESRFGSVECRELTGFDIRTEEQHAAFVEKGLWRDACMCQIEFVIRKMLQEGQ